TLFPLPVAASATRATLLRRVPPRLQAAENTTGGPEPGDARKGHSRRKRCSPKGNGLGKRGQRERKHEGKHADRPPERNTSTPSVASRGTLAVSAVSRPRTSRTLVWPLPPALLDSRRPCAGR